MIELGQEVKDRVTGFKGIAIAKTTWLNGCDRIMVQPKLGKDGKPPEAHQFDEPQLEVVGDGVASKMPPKTKTGGPIPTPTRPAFKR